jgi:uncharacterized membrane protein YhaH (DUF805 family)
MRYAGFSGRALRSEFWWFFAFNLLVSVVASVADMSFFHSHTFRVGYGTGPDQGPVADLATILLLLPNLAVGARRLHDVGRTGWWLLIGMVPCLGFLVLLVFWCTQGERGTNRYGEPPTAG